MLFERLLFDFGRVFEQYLSPMQILFLAHDLNHVCRAFNEHTGVCPFPATGTRVRDI